MCLSSNFYVNSTDTFDIMNLNATWAAEQSALYTKNRSGELWLHSSADVAKPIATFYSGMLSSAVAGTILFGRVPNYPGILNATSDPTSGPNTPHYEMIFGVRSYPC